MMKSRRGLFALALAASVFAASPGLAQQTDYPTGAVRIITPFEPGGGTDIVSRELARWLEGKWKQSILVENKAGASGNLGTDFVAKAKPDGSTLLMTTNATVVINPQLFGDRVKYDPKKDLAPITLVSALPFVFVVPPDSPVKTMEEFIALAKSKPGELDCGSSGVGGGAHLALEMLKSRAGVDIKHVPYKGTGSSVTAIMGSHIDCMFVSILTIAPYIKQDQVRGLAVSSLKRNPAFPDMPAVAELPNLDGFESDLWYGMLAPAGTDPAIIDKIYKETKALLESPEFRGKFEPTGAVLVGNTPAEFAKQIDSDIGKWTEVIKQSGVAGQL